MFVESREYCSSKFRKLHINLQTRQDGVEVGSLSGAPDMFMLLNEWHRDFSLGVGHAHLDGSLHLL